MKYLKTALLVIVIVLSVAAGIPKILLMQQEVDFLAALGFGDALVRVFGIFQAGAGLLLIPAKTRVAGGVIATLALAVSAIALLVGGNTVFGLISFLPALLAAYITFDSLPTKSTEPEKE